jgi:hypothetical protein
MPKPSCKLTTMAMTENKPKERDVLSIDKTLTEKRKKHAHYRHC